MYSLAFYLVFIKRNYQYVFNLMYVINNYLKKDRNYTVMIIISLNVAIVDKSEKFKCY